MNAREIAKLVAETLKNERETYMEWLENEDYEEIEDGIFGFLTEQ